MSDVLSRRYPPGLRERAAPMVISDQYESEWAAMCEVARLLGVGTTETVRRWVRCVITIRLGPSVVHAALQCDAHSAK